jgi:hypothetical protein
VRAFWAGISLLPISACGVATGEAFLDGRPIAPWVRAGIILAVLGAVAAIARKASAMLTDSADAREARLGGPLTRSVAIGPPRRWALWLATVALASVIAYLLNEHRPLPPSLADLPPARALDAVALLGLGLLAPFIADLARGGPTRRVPWAAPNRRHRATRPDDDVFGAVMRLSPALLGALLMAVTIYAVTFAVALHEPAKLLGGFGVLGLFVAALLAEPDLLRAPDELMREAWRSRWYHRQLTAARRLRRALVLLHRFAIPIQVIGLAVGIGAIATGSPPAVNDGSAIAAGTLVTAIVTATVTRVLWYWAATQRNDPIDTRILAGHEAPLKTIAGIALVAGSLCSLLAILIA